MSFCDGKKLALSRKCHVAFCTQRPHQDASHGSFASFHIPSAGSMHLRLGKHVLELVLAFMVVFSSAAHGVDAQQAVPADTTIKLTRSACYGECPNYAVVIHGDGRVEFTTEVAAVSGADEVFRQFARSTGVLMPGVHKDVVSSRAVADLLTQFQHAGFWQLQDRYAASVTDNPTQIVTLVMGGRRKQVVDYVGTEAGMPQSVRDLEDAIDRVAGTARWVDGTAALIPWLEWQGFDFHSLKASELAVAGERGRADQAMVLALIDRGANLSLPIDGSPLPGNAALDPEPAGLLLIHAAFRRGHAQVFQRVAAKGWLTYWGKTRAAAEFAAQGAGCSPELVDAVAAAGVNIDAAEPADPHAYPEEGSLRTALDELGGTYNCGTSEDARVQTALRLLAHGANPNHRDSLGRTPLYGVENLDLLNVLLVHGANATIKSKRGESVVFGSWTDAIVLRLLQAGASPVGHYYDGKTLAQQAMLRKMPGVTKWLADHPEAYKR
jgi:hypothetical protein